MKNNKGKKLLTAAVGVATVSYVVSCGRTSIDSGRDEQSTLPQTLPTGTAPNPAPVDTGLLSGNLVAPPPLETGSTLDTTTGFIAGNLLPPPVPTPLPPEPTTAPPETSTSQSTTATHATEPESTDSSDVTSGLIAGNLVAPPAWTSDPETTLESSQDAGPDADAALGEGDIP